MFGEGKVKSYNAERGFGFIQIENDKKDLFFHISDFPESDQPPRIGENLKFRIVEEYGKRKADYIVRVDIEGLTLQPMQIMYEEYDEHKIDPPKIPSKFLSKMIGVLVLLIVGLIGYELFLKYVNYKQINESKLIQATKEQMYAVSEQIKAVKDLPDKVRLPEREEKRVEPMYSQTERSHYSCDGRTHCSQMTSYEEALFFLRNCPGVEMDGDGDGIPCERQF